MSEPIEAPAASFPVSVIMERRQISGNRWITESWSALGVTVGNLPGPGPAEPRLLVEGARAAQFLWTGLRAEFFADESESYYHNLKVSSPGCYVVARPREDGMPRPVLVTVSFDAAQAYHEGGETVYSVPLPPELYRAAEAFVLAHYVPEKKRKRPLEDWKGQTHEGT
jgi:hypothetical protein